MPCWLCFRGRNHIMLFLTHGQAGLGNLCLVFYVVFLIPDILGSVKGGLPLMAWVLSWTSHWLSTPTIFVPPQFLNQLLPHLLSCPACHSLPFLSLLLSSQRVDATSGFHPGRHFSDHSVPHVRQIALSAPTSHPSSSLGPPVGVG